MHQGLTQVLGAGLAALVAQADLVGVAVVGQGAGVFDGEGRELLVVVPGRVAALGDQAGDQFVGRPDRVVGRVDEVGLDVRPGGGVPLAGLRGRG